MATKDWKLFRNNSLFKHYVKPKNSREHITVSKHNKEVVMGNGVKNGYLVSAFDNGNETRRVFKTKAKAMKFSRSYMRKN